jgi:rhodanese-related sulfurtransferase
MMRVSPVEAYEKMRDEGYVYVDVRTEEEFVDGHPEGAFNIPSMIEGANGLEENREFLQVMGTAFSKDTPIVIGCKKGNRSAVAAGRLTSAGFTRVVDQRAGWDGTRGAFGEVVEPGWSRVGLPREEGEGTRSYAAVKESGRIR